MDVDVRGEQVADKVRMQREAIAEDLSETQRDKRVALAQEDIGGGGDGDLSSGGTTG